MVVPLSELPPIGWTVFDPKLARESGFLDNPIPSDIDAFVPASPIFEQGSPEL